MFTRAVVGQSVDRGCVLSPISFVMTSWADDAAPCCGPHAHSEQRLIRKHIQAISHQLRMHLQRAEKADLVSRVLQRNEQDAYAKSALLAHHLTQPGPPLANALDWIHSPIHRQSLASLFAGDWFLARYAGNYFARDFIPSTRIQLQRAAEVGVDASRVCIHCWHTSRHVHLEDELHVLMLCPRYVRERAQFHASLSTATALAFTSAPGSSQQLALVLQSHLPQDWEALASHAHKIRQSRRRMRTDFQQRAAKLLRHGFVTRKAAWRKKGMAVCRHGVFFAAPHAGFACPCTAQSESAAELWSKACFMPTIDKELRHLVAAPYDAGTCRRLRSLQDALRLQDQSL